MSRILLYYSCLVLLVGGHGFVLHSDPCPAPWPCGCYGTVINCGSVRLDAMPTFNSTTSQYRNLKIELRGNAIVSVPAHAFSKIQMTSSGNLELLLQDNKITTIDDEAFANLENTSIVLDLSNNNLRTLPRAFLKTNKLRELRMLGNSLVFLDREIMTSLGKSLRNLWLGMEKTVIWPQEFSLLPNLYELIVDEIPFHSLPPDAFSGLEDLERLEITKSRLEAIPEDICSLVSLSYFKFTEDHHISNNNNGLLKLCSNTNLPHRDTSTVELSNNQLFSFPSNVFKVFPRPRTLGLSFNYIDHIDDADVPDYCTLYYLYLSDNQFTTIPAVVSKMSQLFTLIISNNKITHIPDNLFSSLQHFKQLVISGNPLIHIDPHAFNSLNTLQRLVIERTDMRSLPPAILHSANSLSLTTTGSPIVCSCDTMYFLKAFPTQGSYRHYYGSCTGNTTVSIQSYILNSLPNC